MTDDEPSSKLKDAISVVEDLVETNDEVIDKVFGGESNSIDVGDNQPLIKAEANEEALSISVETEVSEVGRLGIDEKNEGILLQVGEDKIRVQDVPEDLNMGRISMRFKDGIVAVKIERENQSEGGG